MYDNRNIMFSKKNIFYLQVQKIYDSIMEFLSPEEKDFPEAVVKFSLYSFRYFNNKFTLVNDFVEQNYCYANFGINLYT